MVLQQVRIVHGYELQSIFAYPHQPGLDVVEVAVDLSRTLHLICGCPRGLRYPCEMTPNMCDVTRRIWHLRAVKEANHRTVADLAPLGQGRAARRAVNKLL